MEGEDSHSKFLIKSKTTVTIAPQDATNTTSEDFANSSSTLPPVETLDPNEDPKNIISEEIQRRKLAKDAQAYENQLRKLKATVENFNGVVGEKEKTIGNLKAGITMLTESIGPLDSQIGQMQKALELKKSGELSLLLQKDEENTTLANKFVESVAKYKGHIEEKKRSIAGHRERVAKELEALEAKYKLDAEKDLASIKEMQKSNDQARAEKARQLEEKREQLGKVSELTLECESLLREFQKISDERKSINKKMSELEAGLAQLEHLASQESQSAVDLKIADNKRNAALREKHIASLTAEREMKKKQLAEEKIKSGKLTQDFADVAEERDALEKTQKAKLKELQGLMNECAEKKAEGESTIERTIAYEREMKRKIREARKESDRMSQSILARMNNARKNSVFFQNERAEKEQKEREERERQKEEMREELEELKRTIEGMKESFKKENEAAERYYARIEREKDLFGKDANKDHEFKINLVQERIQQLNVKSSRELAEFDAELKQTTAQIEQEKANLKLVAEVAKASAKMKSDADQEHKLKETLWAIEREFTEQKQKVAELVRQEYDLQKELHKYDILPSEFAPAAPARKESANAPGPISQKQQAQPLNYSIQTQTAITQGKSQQQTQSRIPTASHLAQRSMQTAIPVPREFKLDDEGQMKSLLRQKTAEVQQSLQNFRRGVPQEQQVATMTELMSQSHLSVASKLHLAASQMEAEMRRDKSRIAILKTEGTKDQTKRPLVFQGKANLTPRPG